MVLKLKTRARERSSNTALPLHTWLATNAALTRCACKIPSFRSYRSCVTRPKPDQLIVVPKSNQTATVSHEPFVRKVSLIPTLKGTDIAGLENLRQLLWFWAFLWRVNVLHRLQPSWWCEGERYRPSKNATSLVRVQFGIFVAFLPHRLSSPISCQPSIASNPTKATMLPKINHFDFTVCVNS